jgi:hypothetical protein
MKYFLIVIGVIAATRIELAILVPLLLRLEQHLEQHLVGWVAAVCVLVTWLAAMGLSKLINRKPPPLPPVAGI